MTDEQREAIEWAAGQAYSYAKPLTGDSLMQKRCRALNAILQAATPTGTTMTIDIINSAADATMSPDEREVFDKFSDDTKQRLLNQILKRAATRGTETIDDKARATLKACVRELNAWMKDHGQDLKSIAAIKNAEELLQAATRDAQVLRPTDDELWDQTLEERDSYHLWADKLANAIAGHLDVDIGEHSSANLPWFNALNAIEETANRDVPCTLPRLHGVGRMADNPCALLLMLKAEPTDDDIRAIHELLIAASAPKGDGND